MGCYSHSSPPTPIRESRKSASAQAFKRTSMRQFVALDMSSHMGYCRMYNKQRRKNDQRNNKSRLSSRWREEGRSKENCHQISTGPNPGDAAGTPSLPYIGSQVHRDRIPGPSKSSQQRSSSRVCLELDPTWTCSIRCGSSIVLWQNGYAGACKTSYPGSTPGNTSNINGSAQAHKHQRSSASKQARIADQSSSAQARERSSTSPDSVTAELG